MPPRLHRKIHFKNAGELRRSKMVSTSGCGAIVDFPRLSAIISGIDKWNIREGDLKGNSTISENNLQKMLKKEFFVQVSANNNLKRKFKIPVFRFPTWYYCPECHQLDYYKNIAKRDDSASDYVKTLYCNNCASKGKSVQLIPSRFIVACQNGHIEDFPYVFWAHSKSKLCDKPRLYLEYYGTTGGLDSIMIKCQCGAHRTMAGCMNKDSLAMLHCKGNMPWLGPGEDRGWYKDPISCNASLRTLQRSANNVYYPVTQSALTIPPLSSKLAIKIMKYKDTIQYAYKHDGQEGLRNVYYDHQDEFKCDISEFISKTLKLLGYINSNEEITDEKLRMDEYQALCGVDNNEKSDFFKTRSTEIPDEISPYIDVIKQIDRLREVKVLEGFRRIDPNELKDPNDQQELGLNGQSYAPLSKNPLNWLPAIEMFGEGIFIKLNNKKVREWENNNSQKYDILKLRLGDSWIGNNMFNAKRPRYILLHTLAHLLIRQLTTQCGYEMASLREKIYSTYNGSQEDMCGILIYTSATDSDGSLGGLAREGDGYRLGNTILEMLEETSWCSNDPICIDSDKKGQGYKGLNFAACYACALLPETSCESANCLLDRAAIVGTPEDRSIGYFSGLLELE